MTVKREIEELEEEFIEFNVLWFTGILLSFLILFSLGVFTRTAYQQTIITATITIIVSYLVSYTAYSYFRKLLPKKYKMIEDE